MRHLALIAMLFSMVPTLEAQHSQLRVRVNCGSQGVVDTNWQISVTLSINGTSYTVNQFIPDASGASDVTAALVLKFAIKTGQGFSHAPMAGQGKDNQIITLPPGTTVTSVTTQKEVDGTMEPASDQLQTFVPKPGGGGGWDRNNNQT